jgi:hypothetical protein
VEVEVEDDPSDMPPRTLETDVVREIGAFVVVLGAFSAVDADEGPGTGAAVSGGGAGRAASTQTASFERSSWMPFSFASAASRAWTMTAQCASFAASVRAVLSALRSR